MNSVRINNNRKAKQLIESEIAVVRDVYGQTSPSRINRITRPFAQSFIINVSNLFHSNKCHILFMILFIIKATLLDKL